MYPEINYLIMNILLQISGEFLAQSGFGSFAESLVVVGQASVEGFMTRVLNMFRMIALLFAVAGLMYAAYQLNNGDVRAALMGVLASGLMGAAYVIVVSLFGEPGDGLELDIFLDL